MTMPGLHPDDRAALTGNMARINQDIEILLHNWQVIRAEGCCHEHSVVVFTQHVVDAVAERNPPMTLEQVSLLAAVLVLRIALA